MNTTRRTLLSALLLALPLVTSPGCRSADPRAEPAPVSQPAAALDTAFELAEGVWVWMPPTLPADRPNLDLLVHFHGGHERVCNEARLARLNAVVVTVNYRGLSSAYQTPYSEPDRFPKLLADVLAALRERGQAAEDARWGRVCLSSFSAGYGAIRAILGQADSAARIDGIYLADSLYAGWKDDVPYSGVNPANVAVFRAYAVEAAAGRRTLAYSFSRYDPQKYAGTHETAADLMQFVGVEPRTVDEPGPGDTRIVLRAERGQFKVWELTAPDHAHGRHLQNMHMGLNELPLERLAE